MNEDDLYVEMSFGEYLNLKDQSGYYKVFNYNVIRYYKNGKYHRLNGPAYIANNENILMYYIQNNKCHRLDGPAVVNEIKNVHSYYINDKEYTKEEYYQHQDVIQYRLQKFQESIE